MALGKFAVGCGSESISLELQWTLPSLMAWMILFGSEENTLKVLSKYLYLEFIKNEGFCEEAGGRYLWFLKRYLRRGCSLMSYMVFFTPRKIILKFNVDIFI